MRAIQPVHLPKLAAALNSPIPHFHHTLLPRPHVLYSILTFLPLLGRRKWLNDQRMRVLVLVKHLLESMSAVFLVQEEEHWVVINLPGVGFELNHNLVDSPLFELYKAS